MSNKITNGLIINDFDAHKMRGEHFFKGILDYRERIWSQQQYRIKKPEDFVCVLCGQKAKELFMEWNAGYQLFQCIKCGAVSPNISKEQDQKHFDEVYNTGTYYEKFIREIDKQFEYRKNTFGRERCGYVFDRLNLNKDAKLLDVGCGGGIFLTALKEMGYKNASGTEVNKMQVRYCKEKGLDVESVGLEELPDNTYDVITMFDVLEHLTNPIDLIFSVKKKLKYNGYFLAYTPNIHSVSYELMNSKQNTLLPFEHFCFFNKESFEYLSKMVDMPIFSLETFGFDIMDYLLMKEYEDDVDYTVKLKKMMNLVQAYLDKQGVSNHYRLTMKKE